MKFHWKNGCLPKEEFQNVAFSMKVIEKAIMVPHLAGFIENKQDYWAVDLIMGPDEIKEAVKILNDFANTL